MYKYLKRKIAVALIVAFMLFATGLPAFAVAITGDQFTGVYESQVMAMAAYSNDANSYLAKVRLDATTGGLVVNLDSTSLAALESITITGISFGATSGTTTNEGAQIAKVGGETSGGVPTSMLVEGDGSVNIHADATTLAALESITIVGANFEGTDGTTGPSKAVSIAGTDSSGYIQEILVLATGEVMTELDSTSLTALESITIAGSSFGATSGTTTNEGAQIVKVGGETSGGVPTSLLVESDGSANAHLDATTLTALESITIAGASFGGTDGTSTGLGSQFALVGGVDGTGAGQVVLMQSTGAMSVAVTGFLTASSSASVTATATVVSGGYYIDSCAAVSNGSSGAVFIKDGSAGSTIASINVPGVAGTQSSRSFPIPIEVTTAIYLEFVGGIERADVQYHQ